ncbi:MAG: hypothetical protein ABGY71_10130 [bacterium]
MKFEDSEPEPMAAERDFDWAALRSRITTRKGAWIIERHKVSAAHDTKDNEVPTKHLLTLATLWQTPTLEGVRHLDLNGFDKPEMMPVHPALRAHEAWSSHFTEYLKRDARGQVHIRVERSNHPPPESTTTVEYRHDGLIAEQVTQDGVSFPTVLSDKRVSNRFNINEGKFFIPVSIGASGSLGAIEGVLIKVDGVLGQAHRRVPGKSWDFSEGKVRGRIPLFSPSERELCGTAVHCWGFESIPGYLLVQIDYEPGMERGRLELHWMDALDWTLATESLEWREDGSFDLRKVNYMPGTLEVKLLRTSSSIPDSSAAAASRSCRWVPRVGEPVVDQRGTNHIRYQMGESGEIPSLTSLEESTIHERAPGIGLLPGTTQHDQRSVAQPITLLGRHLTSEISLGDLPYGDTPLRIQLDNDTIEHLGIMNLSVDCGCIDLHMFLNSIDPGGLGFLNCSIAVRSSGSQKNSIRLEYMAGVTRETVVHTINLSYNGIGSFAVQPGHTYLGTQVAGSMAQADLRVLLPDGGSMEDLEVFLEGQPRDFTVVSSDAGGRRWIRIGVPVSTEALGAVDCHLRLTHNDITAVSTVSYSVAPTEELAEDWPGCRLPLSRVWNEEIRFPRFGDLELVVADLPAGLSVMKLADGQGLNLRMEERGEYAGRVQPIVLGTRFGPLRILVK